MGSCGVGREKHALEEKERKRALKEAVVQEEKHKREEIQQQKEAEQQKEAAREEAK